MNKSKSIIPPLKKIPKSKKKIHYKLSEPFSKRKKAILSSIELEMKLSNKNFRNAAKSKKARFNVLRIYRKNSKNKKKQKECRTLTRDMKYLNKLIYSGNNWKDKTKNICSK